MANVHSAIKEIRKNNRKRVQNQAVLSELKSTWMKLTRLPKTDIEKAKTMARELTSKWDKAVSSKIVPKGRADRKKSRIAHLLGKLSQ